MNFQRKIIFLFIVGIFASILPALAVAAESKKQDGTLMVIVNFIYDDYYIDRAWVIKQVYPPLNQNSPLPNDLTFQLATMDNVGLMTVRIPDPHVIRHPLTKPDEVQKVGELGSNNIEGSLILRLPYYKNVRYVNLIESGSIEASVSANNVASKPAIILKQMDLANHLVN